MAEGVKQYKDLTLVFENSGSCPFKVSTDMPGSTMQVRRTIQLPATSGRATKTFPFDDGGQALLEGKLIKYRAEPSGVLKLYTGSFVRFRVIGEYIDGTVGEVWETQELIIGV